MSSDELLAGLEQKWDKAVNHEFIKACIDGSVKPEQFNRWLVQDYYYVRGFTPFAGSLLASAPDSHLEPIVGGIAALTDELAWFKDTAQKRGCDVTIIGMQPACVAYCQFLQQLHGEPYAIKAVAFWAIEACYHQAWSSVLQNATSAELKEYSHRWGNPAFGEYVAVLRGHADEALAFTPELLPQARQVVERVADLEVDFWGMAYSEQ
eukprot:GHRQ01028623.1.p2 GENE.GHRQ01028623.1~~GHRQ01028623.1.p2  ORF type:complete len:208 (+),score=93.15 GHRQ01028623.1:682-1305(+)